MDYDELGVRAYEELYGRTPRKIVKVNFSGRFKNYGANITSSIAKIEFRLSKEFLEVGEEIIMGVMQHLYCKLNKTKTKTLEMDLYDKFLKNVGEWATAGGGEIEDEELKESFDRVNEQYFDGLMDVPNISWTGENKTLLGHYTFSTDSVTISSVLRGGGEYLDFVLYHELLHKKHKYEVKNGRTQSHTPAFRRDERKFKMSNGMDSEKALSEYLRSVTRQKKKAKGFVQRLLESF